MEAYANAVRYGMIAFILLIIVELVVSKFIKKEVYHPFDAASGISSGITNNVKTIFNFGIVVLSYEYMVSHWAVFELPASVYVFVGAFIGVDLVSYWSHRLNHRFNLLWNRHMIHHSSEDYNLSVALRQPIADIFKIYFFLFIPMAILGVPALVIAIVVPVHLFLQFWYHTQLINKMGWLEHILVTPSHHRVHHAINPAYLDKNFSAVFIIWDKLFGTFQAELADDEPVYGVTRAVQTWNPFYINIQHFWQLCKDAWHTNIWKDKLRIWFMPTGWRPSDVVDKYPVAHLTQVDQQVKYESQTTTFLTGWIIFQVSLHIAVQFHLIDLIPTMSPSDLVLYGIFIWLSIFSYTTLMDRSPWAIPAEIIKILFALYILNHFGQWFDLDAYLPQGISSRFIVLAYLAVSFIITAQYSRMNAWSYKSPDPITP